MAKKHLEQQRNKNSEIEKNAVIQQLLKELNKVTQSVKDVDPYIAVTTIGIATMIVLVEIFKYINTQNAFQALDVTKLSATLISVCFTLINLKMFYSGYTNEEAFNSSEDFYLSKLTYFMQMGLVGFGIHEKIKDNQNLFFDPITTAALLGAGIVTIQQVQYYILKIVGKSRLVKLKKGKI